MLIRNIQFYKDIKIKGSSFNIETQVLEDLKIRNLEKGSCKDFLDKKTRFSHNLKKIFLYKKFLNNNTMSILNKTGNNLLMKIYFP